MIRSRHFILPVLALCLVACSKEESREAGGLVMHTITAGIEGATKVQIVADPEAENKAKVLWSAGEVVDVWVGDKAHEFVGQNAAAALSTTFRGTAPANLGEWVLVYPQGASTGKSDNVITATLPAVQTAVAGSFDTDAALIAGLGTGASVTCKHLYSGIRFRLTTDSGIKSISLRGNNGEKIAGTFSFDISSGSPVITGGSSETIVLNAPGGGTFIPETWYYILCLPTTFSKGVTITADNGTQVGYFTTGTSTTFTRTKIKNKDGLTIGNWADIGLAGTVHYGPANTICLRTGASTTIDVTPSLTTAGWQRSGMETAVGAAVPDRAEVLWGNSTISSADLADGKLTVTVSDTPGSALVAIKKDGTILWSFLVWVTASEPASIDLPSGAILQEPLGGQLYFQWGRKDPLRAGFPCVENKGDNGLSYSIQHPDKYIDGGGNTSDWLTNDTRYPDDNLWGGSLGTKTVWDPCPEGWRVPTETDLAGLDGTYKDKFNKYGLLLPDGTLSDFDWRAYCWTREPYGSSAKSLLMETNEYGFIGFSITGDARYPGLSVRCVKE